MLFILGLLFAAQVSEGVNNTTTINVPITATSGPVTGLSPITTTSLPFTTDYHPFESLSLATKAVIYTVALLLGLGCVIASSGCCAWWVCCKRRHAERHLPAGDIDPTDHTEDVTRTQFKYIANNTTITQSADRDGLGIQNPFFAQESSSHGPSRVHLPAQDPAKLSVPVPGKGRESSSEVGGRGSLRSVPEETLHASNRMASSIIYSDTMPDGIGTHTCHHQSAVYHQSSV